MKKIIIFILLIGLGYGAYYLYGDNIKKYFNSFIEKEEYKPILKKDKYTFEEKEKLEKLDFINESINYFVMNNIDRYIDYKEKNDTLSNEEIVKNVNMNLDYDFYTNSMDSLNKDTVYLLVNKFYYLDSAYEPIDLKTISYTYSNGTKLKEVAANAFELMANDAKAAGYTLKGISGYRSYSTQNNIYNSYLTSDPVDVVDTYSARPGYSEHQTGLAIDVSNGVTSYNQFGSSTTFTWMNENAYKYGFILRYQQGKENVTGYKYEPWHYRYVGNDIAKIIHDNNISLEEYYAIYLVS